MSGIAFVGASRPSIIHPLVRQLVFSLRNLLANNGSHREKMGGNDTLSPGHTRTFPTRLIGPFSGRHLLVSGESGGSLFPNRPTMKVSVIGLGYVGLPLSLQFARSGVEVLGIDIDPAKVEQINNGQSYIQHIESSTIRAAISAKHFSATTDFKRVREVAAVIICVPTPLNKNREPDISYVIKTGEAIAPHLTRGILVVLESTTYPGTTETNLREVLEKHSGLRAGVDFHLAYSPEREDPGNPNSRVAEIPKVVGGLTPACLEKAKAVYSRAIKTLIPVSSCRAAEATKLLENIFRGVNIALVNELKVVYSAMDIDIWEVIHAARTKPFGFMPFYPGPGLGGHCIPIDPFYLTWKAREYGQQTRFIELAGEINTAMPEYVVNRVAEALNAQRKAVNGSRVLLIGLAYKPDVDDVRESPAFVLMNLLQTRGAQVSYHDPHVPIIRPTREHSHWAGTISVAWNIETVSQFDAVLICTAHRAVNYKELGAWAGCIIDARNAMADVPTKPGQVWKA
ncbi:MAG: UDP-N-acetyl-D-glucosamine 6-dehydrogenase [Pedosphaera sp.]|nr:UDP-N-acetyl-D-glucosamine 6-dehydrogenase [Pedosphaera sp.]